MDFAIRLVNSVLKLPDGLAGFKESHFYSLSFGQAESSVLLAHKSFQLAPRQKLFDEKN